MRAQGAGLGAAAVVAADGGDSYLEHVKRLARARFYAADKDAK